MKFFLKYHGRWEIQIKLYRIVINYLFKDCKIQLLANIHWIFWIFKKKISQNFNIYVKMYKMKSNVITPSFQLIKTLLLFLPYNATKRMWILHLYKYFLRLYIFYNIILNVYNILHSTQYSFLQLPFLSGKSSMGNLLCQSILHNNNKENASDFFSRRRWKSKQTGVFLVKILSKYTRKLNEGC